MSTISGSVDRIVFHNADTGFCVARFSLSEDGHAPSGSTTIVGAMPGLTVGEMVRLEGMWQTHPVHGRNFRVERFEPHVPDTREGIERYLASGAIRGIGPVTASRIVEMFGDSALRVLDEEPERLREVGGISAKRLAVITASWSEQQRVRELAMFLQEHGVSVALARRVYERYGDGARGLIAEDPYRLAHEVHGIGFRTADALAQHLGLSPRSPSRYVAGLKYTLSLATDDGHVFLSRAELIRRAVRILEARPPEIEVALLDLLARKEAVIESDRVYLTPFYLAETGTARLIERLRGTAGALTLGRRPDVDAIVDAAEAEQGIALATGQREAVRQALREKVSLLTGGPGTGKTQTLRTVIAALEEQGMTYCLCAPTGRAAKRVAETAGRPASTIHRLLEYQPATGLFGYDAARPLGYDFVVVDEASMLDLLLFYHLLKAVPPEAHLLLVGDADQLPAVGPGRVLADLLESEAVPAVRLTQLFRQAAGSQIVLAAHAINRGHVPEPAPGGNGDFYVVAADSPDSILLAIKKLLAERIPARFGLDPVGDVQVISPMHNGPVGVSVLNRELQALLNPPRTRLGDVTHAGRVFRVGDKVMQIRNNYERDVYNGDVGRVIRVVPDDVRLVVEFPSFTGSVEVEYSTSDLDELALAYAISVHKAQGSEFPCVVMPLTTGHYMLLRRNLLYTAVTRARTLCVLVGSRKALGIAVDANRLEVRNSGLTSRLRGRPHALELELPAEPRLLSLLLG